MKKLLLFAGAFLLAFTLMAQKSWVGFTSDQAQLPAVTVVDQTDNQLILDISVSGMYVTDVTEADQNFQRLELLPMRTTKNIGQPELPMLGEVIGIPGNKMINVEIIGQETTKLTGYNIYPFQTPTTDNPGGHDREFVMDQGVYSQSRSIPGRQVYIDCKGIWRDVKIANLHVVPFNYNPVTQELEVTTSLQLKVTFSGTDTEFTFNQANLVSPVFYNMYKNSLINFESMGLTKGIKDNNSTKYLVITNTGAVETIQPLVDWKNQQGYKVEVKTLETGFEDPQDFKDYISELYASDNLEYILIVGDAYPNGGTAGGSDIVPMFWWAPGGEDPSYSDSWYTCMDGSDDHYADIAIGRFVYDDLDELELQIQKTMDHYLAPDTETNWAENTILIAHEEQYPAKYTQCCEEIRTYSYALQTPIFEQAYGGAGYSNTEVVDYVNANSCGIFNYRGHGSATELWEWCPQGSFTSQHVNQLTNDDRLFVFFDVCCDNMDIVAHAGDCLCESFMKSPVASVAVNGAIIPSYTIPNHDYDKEMYKAVFDEGIYNIGYVTNYANVTVLNVHGDIGRSNVRTYLWLGDASIEPWTLQPADLTVSHDEQLFLGLSTFSVNVLGAEGPAENALVCVTNEDQSVYGIAYADASGVAEIVFDEAVQVPGIATVTVTYHNHLPYQIEIPIIPQEGPYVVKDSYSINDAAGNNDGMMDYGESILLNLAVKNVGIQTATNVSVTLSTDDPFVTLTDDTEIYGDIGPDEILEMSDAFALDVANDIPDGHYVLIEVEASGDDDASWSSSFSIGGHAPVLELQTFVISDASGNNNGKIDPGETVNFFIDVENTGSSSASNVMGMLSAMDSFLTITESESEFGFIGAGDEASGTFEATASISTPAGHMVELTLDISADLDIVGEGTFNVVIGQIPVLILDLDPNNSSGSEMEAALQTMDVACEVLTSFPDDLNLYTSVFCCLGIYSSNHVLSSTEGQDLSAYLNNGGNLYMEGGDTWYYDSQTAVHSMFNINGTSDGSGDLGTVVGQSGEFTEGMSFNYSGENNWIDHIDPVSPAVNIFNNQSPNYGTGIAYDAGTYKTIGASHEFGGLDDGSSPSTKAELMAKYIEFFGMSAATLQALFYSDATSVCEEETVGFSDMSTGDVISWAWTFEGGSPGTSSAQNPAVMYFTAGTYDVTLEVSDGTETISTTMEDYITVGAAPEQAATPEGQVEICTNYMPSSYEYTTMGAEGADTYVWMVSPTEAGTISGEGLNAEFEFTPDWEGTAIISVQGVNDCGEGVFSEELEVLCEICIGVDEYTLGNSTQIYPNPTSGIFTIEFSQGTGQTAIRIMNILGEMVYENNLEITNSTLLDVDLGDLTKGVYFARIKSGDAEIIRKVVVK